MKVVGGVDKLGIGLIGGNEFLLVQATEIKRYSDGGKTVESLGFMMNHNSLDGLPTFPSLSDLHQGKTVITKEPVLVMSNGKVSYRVTEPLLILDDDGTSNKKRERSLSSLSSEERGLLGL